MKIQEIQQKQVWEDFISEFKRKTFLHSWNWAEFQEKSGEKVWRLGIFNNNELIGAALIIKSIAKRGVFLVCPHGPMIKKQKNQVLAELTKFLKDLAIKERAWVIRICPVWEKNTNKKDFKDLGYINSPVHIHPEATWVLDLNDSEQELLKKMRKTTRYLIRQGTKNKDIKVFQSTDLKDVEIFKKLHDQTAKRLNFTPFSLDYLKNEFSVFKENDQIRLFIGKYKGEVAAMSFVVYWSGIGFYHHAVSVTKFRKYPIAYLLQWEAIKEAKKRNCELYDFWGYVDPKSNHPWAGPTLFKMGFGGRKLEHVKTKDLVVSKKYWLTYVFEKIRKIKRRF